MSGLAALCRLRRAATSVAIAAVLPLAAPAAASAAASPAAPVASGSEEQVLKDDVAIKVGPGGVAHVRETITYRFSGQDGFSRTFVTREHQSVTEDRLYRIDGARASSPDGGPTRVSISESGTRTTLKVTGAAELTGSRTVVLDYELRGAITPMGAAEELRWTAVGGWKVPVTEARAVVDGGAVIRDINCFAGPIDSTIGCTQYYTNHTRTQGIFSQQQMLPGEYLTVVAGLPAGTTKGEPIYERRHTVATAFAVNAVTGAALLGVLVLLAGGLIALYLLRGRDARVVGRKAVEGDQAPLAGTEFEPPNGVRPGQIGTLVDEQADVIDVTASIVDLAVRGHLLIEEEDRAVTGRLDWTLRGLDRPAGDLLPYERILLDALLTAPDGSARGAVKLSELGGTFSTRLAQVRSAMYADVVQQGWFARRPDTVRSRWTVAGLALTVLGVAGTVALALTTEYALVGLAVIIAGAALAYGGQYMPAKTARGATVLAHTIGFRAFLGRGALPEDAFGGLASRQRIALFSRFLPYAVVFGLVAEWAETVKDAGERAEGADNLYWYEGPAEWDLSKFAESMRTFTLATSGSISQSRGL
ncbi:DUF2207 domain-containing protein [Actinomadura xylanilytica]|uniref:DUF2207 domain-containing protein n=1 Tax=Actinomadura xylanilytica TaxID=887459 RepID=UPI00255B1842|nr:DUF2207 domain-containing protein [Actinomadura xylanilytica]MDL4772797.1 DUF2207 domain-containing protein [Actinomadura xylanilytica]